MVRPFNFRDLALIHRLRDQGVLLHTKSALTNTFHPLRGAILSMFPGGGFPTYVWKADEGDSTGFIQLFFEEGSHHGHILYLSSTPHPDSEPMEAKLPHLSSTPHLAPLNTTTVDEAAWLPLLDQAVVETGRSGLHTLVAEVSEVGAELPILRRAGFAVYTRQDVWVFSRPDELEKTPTKILQACRAVDDWEIQLLYSNTVPRLVQLVDPIPMSCDENGWVLRDNGEVMAYVHIDAGPIATWLGLLIHPSAESQVEEIITAALQVHPPRRSHPVYCCVRRYQSWLQGPLERVGFTHWGSQAMMVKHTVQQAKRPSLEQAPNLQRQRAVPAPTPLIHSYQPKNGRKPCKG